MAKKAKYRPDMILKDKDYITEAYLQGGKAIGDVIKQKKKR